MNVVRKFKIFPLQQMIANIHRERERKKCLIKHEAFDFLSSSSSSSPHPLPFLLYLTLNRKWLSGKIITGECCVESCEWGRIYVWFTLPFQLSSDHFSFILLFSEGNLIHKSEGIKFDDKLREMKRRFLEKFNVKKKIKKNLQRFTKHSVDFWDSNPLILRKFSFLHLLYYFNCINLWYHFDYFS